MVQSLKNDLENEIASYKAKTSSSAENLVHSDILAKNIDSKAIKDSNDRKLIATMFQRYLLLAFFSCIPDRQRTFRELRLEKTFIRVSATSSNNLKGNEMDYWVIQHGPDV